MDNRDGVAGGLHGRLLWAVLCGGLVMGLALGVRHVQGLFLVPMTMDRDWSREAFGFALALQNLAWGLAQPFTGMVADRFGARRVVVAGLLLYLLGLGGMSGAATPLGLAAGNGLVVGMALSGTAFGTVYGALSRIVPAAQRSAALGLAGAAGGLGQFLMVPLAQGLIERFGWSAALLALAGAFAAILPAARGLDDRAPAGIGGAATAPPSGPPMREALREAFAHRGFWLLNLGFLACGFQLAFLASHLPAYLLDRGLAPRVAVAGLATIALANVAGTWLCGWAGGRWRRKRLLAGIYLLRSAAMALFLMLPLSPLTVYAFCAAMGLLWLGTVPLTSALLAQVFGVRWIATLFGFVFLGHQLGAFLGVWLGARVFDATGSYEPLWLGSMALGLLAAALHWPIDDREIRRPRVAAAGA